MKTFNELVNKIRSCVYIKDENAFRGFVDDLEVMILSVDFTTDQICELIELLADIREDLGSGVLNDVLLGFTIHRVYPKISKIPEEDLYKIVSFVYDNYGDWGLSSLMSKNFSTIESLKLFVLIFTRSKSNAHKDYWLGLVRVGYQYPTFMNKYRDKILLMFGWIK